MVSLQLSCLGNTYEQLFKHKKKKAFEVDKFY